MLAAPDQSLADVVPLRVLDDLEMPDRPPIRVATRPTLDWRPGLREASERIGSTPDAAASLRVVEEPPRLVAPVTRPSSQPETAPAVPKVDRIDPPETAKLPLATPQRKAKQRPASRAAEPVQPDPVTRTPKAPEGETKTEEPADEEQVTKPDPAPKRPAKAPKSDQVDRKPKVVEPVEPPPPLSRGLRNLRSRLRTVLSFYYRKPLNTAEHDPWEIMHSMLSYELHSRVRDGGPSGPYMTAVGHLCFNRPSKRQQMMVLTNDGLIDTEVGVGLQGHKGQFLAMLAQCNVSPEYPIRVGGESFTIRDLIESEQKTCYSNTELTFKLIGLGHYLDSDAQWLNDQGETWDLPRLIREEREQPIRGAACGGTHRLAGLSLAFRRREARGEPVDGEYAEASKFVSQYQAYAFRLQNSDGSLSTEWFRGRGDEEDIDRRLRTTGHLMEWLVYSLPDDQLRSQASVRAVNYLTTLLATNADHEWHLGSVAHALHALVLYDKRIFRPHDQDATAIASAVDPTRKLFRDYPIYRGVMRNSPPEPRSFLGGLFGTGRSTGAASRR